MPGLFDLAASESVSSPPVSSSAPVLPSADSAQRLLDGQPGALGDAILHVLGRAVLVGLGMAAVPKVRKSLKSSLPVAALAGSLAIEGFVLAYLSKKS